MTLPCGNCGSANAVSVDWFDEDIVFVCAACASPNRLDAEQAMRLLEQGIDRRGPPGA